MVLRLWWSFLFTGIVIASFSRTIRNERLKFVSNQTNIDEQLYSRQISVFGKSAQQLLSIGRILVIGDGPIAAEVIKNLALTGVGEIHLNSVNNERKFKDKLDLLGSHHSLAQYAQSLNPAIKVKYLISLLSWCLLMMSSDCGIAK